MRHLRSIIHLILFVGIIAGLTACGGGGGGGETTWYKDIDGDDYSDGVTQLATNRPVNYYLPDELVAISGDCDDNNDTVHPRGVEIDGDGLDQDCNGIELLGPQEVVFDWTTERCEDLDIPDLPARAFRDASNQVQLISSHLNVRRSIGANLNNLVHDCTIVMPSHRDPDPAQFNDSEWIGATYTEDGTTIYAIVHNEYHGYDHPGQCSFGPQYWSDCWYNGLTLAISTDGGLSYQHPVVPPLHLIASLPEQYQLDQGPSGAFHPSNIVKRNDGYYYAIVHLVESTTVQWSCLIRTSDLADPDAWRFWDGTIFGGRFVNPYTDQFADASEHVCYPIDEIVTMTQSLIYSEYLDRYLLMGTGYSGEIPGFYYSMSEDLINWTPRRLLIEKDLSWSVSNSSEIFYQYPSFLDPDSTSRNFETVGKTAYIYFTRFNRTNGDLDRDMLRVPIEFFMQ